MADEVPRWLMRFRRVREVSGADSRQGSGGFQGQKADEVQRVLVHIPDEVPKGFGAEWPSKIFRAVGDNT